MVKLKVEFGARIYHAQWSPFSLAVHQEVEIILLLSAKLVYEQKWFYSDCLLGTLFNKLVQGFVSFFIQHVWKDQQGNAQWCS